MQAAVAEVLAQRKEGFKTKSRATANKRGVPIYSLRAQLLKKDPRDLCI